jgi:hypothetical protein
MERLYAAVLQVAGPGPAFFRSAGARRRRPGDSPSACASPHRTTAPAGRAGSSARISAPLRFASSAAARGAAALGPRPPGAARAFAAPLPGAGGSGCPLRSVQVLHPAPPPPLRGIAAPPPWVPPRRAVCDAVAGGPSPARGPRTSSPHPGTVCLGRALHLQSGRLLVVRRAHGPRGLPRRSSGDWLPFTHHGTGRRTRLPLLVGTRTSRRCGAPRGCAVPSPLSVLVAHGSDPNGNHPKWDKQESSNESSSGTLCVSSVTGQREQRPT